MRMHIGPDALLNCVHISYDAAFNNYSTIPAQVKREMRIQIGFR